MTKVRAVELCDSGWWKNHSALDIATLQLFEPRLIVSNFKIFAEAMNKALQRETYRNEYAESSALKKELLRKHPFAIQILRYMRALYGIEENDDE